MRRSHEMPFGAECLPDGRVRFRLWAPAVRDISLCVEDAKREISLAMERTAGWFELVTDQAGPGSRYRFQIEGGLKVPDPASRFQPQDVHGPSEVIDGASFEWEDEAWNGRPWEEAVIYELHVGTFTPEGTFATLEQRLDYLVKVGVTAVELMPVADFPGTRNWGYDGVLPFAPDSQYGGPDSLKRLIQAAHQKGLMMFLDVVYNHFGPEGNYLRAYAPQFFTERHHTPWGDAINLDGPESRVVRDFFIHNALYWLTEYQFDGLRLDAVHAIVDDSTPDILSELASRVRAVVDPKRHVHLVLENDDNAARCLKRDTQGKAELYDAQWNDDIHHAMHVALTGEKDGYYRDYADCPVQRLGRCLTQGFDYQGEASLFRRGARRGEPSRDLPPAAFVSFLQNHDQVGNRAFGERILKLADPRAVRAAMTILLLSPSPPLLFMGEEFGAETPFLFFCDFGADLAKAVTEGRRNEFSRFARFSDPAARAEIPDPNASSTFQASKLDWESATEPRHRSWMEFYRELLKIRQRQIIPWIHRILPGQATFEMLGRCGLMVSWPVNAGAGLTLLANLGNEGLPEVPHPIGKLLFTSDETVTGGLESGQMPPWSAAWLQR
ncbi:MAG TPA: malto-oligosyltrehalose trehalohydrolase [Terriglobales bacterium]|nr:malto-oligosyltrehalose trehalohydrolase [Terriglobales bacterium]